MDPTKSYELDNEGNAKVKPVIGWSIGLAYASVVLLQIEYLPEDMSEGSKALLFSLSPQVCLDISEELTKQARLLLQNPLPPGKSPN
jgi:hypothetical protein